MTLGNYVKSACPFNRCRVIRQHVSFEVIDEYGLRDRIGFFIKDNANWNDRLLRYVAHERFEFDPELC